MITVPGQRVFRLRVFGMLFDTAKAFLLPNALPGLKTLAEVYAKHQGFNLLVIGHTDRVGQVTDNDELSVSRAAAVAAYLKDDIDAWLQHYDTSIPKSSRWGFSEDMHMLGALPFGHSSYLESSPSITAAAKAFQHDHGLDVDGIIGPKTRRALIKEYMALDGTSLPESTTLTTHGCGEHFNAIETGDNVEEPANRRVELFFFGGPIRPPPPSETSTCGSPEYPEWVDQCLTTTDLDIGEGADTPFVAEIYAELRSNSGAIPLKSVAYELRVGERRFRDCTDESGKLFHTHLSPGDYELLVEWGDEALVVPISTRPPGLDPILIRVRGARADVDDFFKT